MSLLSFLGGETTAHCCSSFAATGARYRYRVNSSVTSTAARFAATPVGMHALLPPSKAQASDELAVVGAAAAVLSSSPTYRTGCCKEGGTSHPLLLLYLPCTDASKLIMMGSGGLIPTACFSHPHAA